MARYKCPCCGKPFDGKRCRECYYEHFTEEIAHGFHVHEGEPLVVKGTQSKRAVRPVPAQPDSCRPYPGRKKKRSSAGKWLVAAVVILLSILSELPLNDGGAEIFDREPEPSIQVSMPGDGTVLYEDGSLTVIADWQDGQEYQGEISIYVCNQTDREMTVSSHAVYVNGFLMDSAIIYCDIPSGETVRDNLWLDEYELADSGIETVAEIMLCLDIYDDETYEPYAQSEWVTLQCGVPLGFQQPVESSGQVLCDQDGVRVVYQGCEGTECEDAWLVFFVENETDKTAELYTGEVRVNGSEADLFMWCDLLPGTRAVTRVQLYSLPEMGVDTVDEIQSLELSLGWVFDGDWDNWIQTELLTVDVDG